MLAHVSLFPLRTFVFLIGLLVVCMIFLMLVFFITVIRWHSMPKLNGSQRAIYHLFLT